MKVKSILASLGACAIAVSAMAISASAKVTNPAAGDDKYCLDVVLPEGKTFADIYGIEMSYTGTPAEGQTNVGAICWQSTSVKWTQKEFSLTEGEKELVVKDNKVTYKADAPLFAAADEYAQVFVAQWSWTDDNQMDFTVDSVKLLDKDGNELGGAAPTQNDQTDAPKNDNTTAPANNTTAPANNTTAAAGAKTGDAGVGIAVGALALAGVAAVATRKKH